MGVCRFIRNVIMFSSDFGINNMVISRTALESLVWWCKKTSNRGLADVIQSIHFFDQIIFQSFRGYTNSSPAFTSSYMRCKSMILKLVFRSRDYFWMFFMQWWSADRFELSFRWTRSFREKFTFS